MTQLLTSAVTLDFTVKILSRTNMSYLT